MHYITSPQKKYSLFLEVTIIGDHGEKALRSLTQKWAKYITRINVNEGLTELQLEMIFMDFMGDFYQNIGIRLMEQHIIVDKVKEINTPKLICDLVPRQKYLVNHSLLQLSVQQGYRVTHIHNYIRFKQAPFIFECVNMLSEKRANPKPLRKEPVQATGKLALWQIRGDWIETDKSVVRHYKE